MTIVPKLVNERQVAVFVMALSNQVDDHVMTPILVETSDEEGNSKANADFTYPTVADDTDDANASRRILAFEEELLMLQEPTNKHELVPKITVFCGLGFMV